MTTNTRSRNHPGKRWSTADRINGVAALIAILGLIAGVAVPDLGHLISYLKRPQASFSWPHNNGDMPNNTFAATGTAKNIPADSQLWLVIVPTVQGKWYPVGYLHIVSNSWHVPPREICPAPGLQELVIYSVPDSEAGSLYSYESSKAEVQGVGINSMPLGSTVMATAQVTIPAHVRPFC